MKAGGAVKGVDVREVFLAREDTGLQKGIITVSISLGPPNSNRNSNLDKRWLLQVVRAARHGPTDNGTKLVCALMGIADLHLLILLPVAVVRAAKLAVNEALSEEDEAKRSKAVGWGPGSRGFVSGLVRGL